MADGIGRQSLELISSLKDQFNVHYKNTRDIDYKDVPKDLFPILHNRKKPFGKVIIFEDTLSIKDDQFRKMPAGIDPYRIKIAYSMFESTQIPPIFVQRLNDNFDAVVVPDPFLIDIYKNCGVTKPLFVLPLGLNLSNFFLEPIKIKKNSPMIFGCFASCELRKNLTHLVKAFYKAFGNSSDVQLIIHSRRSHSLAKEQLLNEIDRLELSNVIFQESSLSSKEYLDLFKKLDVYVSLSKGEGYSIPPREAMALGLPVVLSDNSAQSTLCRSGLVKVIPSTILEPAVFDALNLTSGHYFNVDIDRAASALKDVYLNYDQFLHLNEKSRDYAKNFDYSYLNSYYKTFVRPKNIILGQENLVTPDTLTTSSHELYNKYKKIFGLK